MPVTSWQKQFSVIDDEEATETKVGAEKIAESVPMKSKWSV